MHVHFREPGNSEAETILSGAQAAAHGGFTSVLMMPNTRPPLDSPEKIADALSIAAKQKYVHVMTAGCISKGRTGKKLADLRKLASAGSNAFTDDGSTVADNKIMAEAMRIAKTLNIPILDHALDPVIAGNGVIHQGLYSTKYNLPGIPADAESVIVDRDIQLSETTGCPVHIQHVSTKKSVDLIKTARKRGVPVSGEATPHHLALTDADVDPRNANFKMNPPLRTEQDRKSLLAAVADGTLEALATDHAPHTRKEKAKGFTEAPFGIIGLETAVGITYMLLVKNGFMSLIEWVSRWTLGPSRILRLNLPCLSAGNPANITILDLNSEWIIASGEFLSKSKNTPFEGRKASGRAIYTFYDGIMTWDALNR